LLKGETTDFKVLYCFLLFSIFVCAILGCYNWLFPFGDDTPFLFVGMLNLLLLGLLRYTKSKFIVGNLYLGIWTIILSNLSFQTGGVYSMDAISLALIPLMAVVLIDHKAGIAWLMIYFAFIGYLLNMISTPELNDFYRAQTLAFDKNYYAIGGIIIATFTSGIVSIFYFQNRKLIAKLQENETVLKAHVAKLNRQSILLNKAKEDLKRSNADLEEYAHVTSHDLMQPLRTVNNFAKLLETHLKREEVNDKRSTEMLQFIVGGTNKMQGLITDLLAFAKLRKESDLKYSPINLKDLLLSVQADLKKQIDSSGVTIENTGLPELHVIPVKMNQLFQNLISNAIKFRKKEEALIIQIGAIEKMDHWELFVKDNGIGIEKEFQQKIFEPFKKLHHSSVYSGSGIGLATCMQIVKLHQGHMWAASTFGEGSTFFFTIKKDLSTTHHNNINTKVANTSILAQAISN